MAGEIVLTSLVSGLNKGSLKQDNDGYYYMELGALNVFNSAGEFYTSKDVEQLFTGGSSVLMRRIKNGALYSEMDHPALEPNMTPKDFLSRNLKIIKSNHCAHIREVVLVPTKINAGMPNEGNVIKIFGWVKPAGVHGDVLKQSLDNIHENVAFSIRCLHRVSIVNGVRVKRIINIITWDWVTEPGIATATKWDSLANESIVDEELLHFDIEDIADDNGGIDECFNCSLEDADTRACVKEIIDASKSLDTKKSILDKW